MKKIFITGTAGFIGFHLAKLLLDNGFKIHGYDGMTDYYDVNLKYARHNILLKNPNFAASEGMLEDHDKLYNTSDAFQPDAIIHLAAQAGVRYSLDNPRAFISSNIVGTFNVMEIARIQKVKHLLIASTSSIYGSNTNMPFTEIEKADSQLSIYAASKKANESMAHAYSHLWKIPTTLFRFFTVYGPWGRPDMALFKFVSSILNDKPIDVFNKGEMYRDFTYVDDVVNGIRLLIDVIPGSSGKKKIFENDSLSSVAPYRVVNIGNSNIIKVIDFINVIEEVLGKKAICNFMPMQKGDVKATWSDASLLQNLTEFSPRTNFRDGIKLFIEWYRKYYNV